VVPVGHDQKQHIEFARDIAGSVNAAYGQELLKLPEGLIAEATAELPGLDGRKMSKSYGNTIPIFALRAELEKLCMKVKTDSRAPADAKDTDSLIYKLFTVVAGPNAAKDFHDRFIPGGMGYGQAKKELFEMLDLAFSPARERYEALMNDTDKLDAILERGAVKARARAQQTMKRVRLAAGFKA
jgi:tryptophanyl-tRNA synthetase